MPTPLSTHLARRRAAQQLRVPRLVETRYVQQLRRIMGQVHEHVLSSLGETEPRMRQDAKELPARFHALNVTIQAAVKRPVGEAYDRMARDVVRTYDEAGKFLGWLDRVEQPMKLAGIGYDVARPVVDKARQENIDLIANAARDYAQDVQDVFLDPDNEGLSTDDLKAMLLERGSVSESRAELIARDQVVRLHGQVNSARQQAAGVSRFTWSTSLDDRVREAHQELEGKVFSWDDLPTVDGEPDVMPGCQFQCRCVALPVFEDPSEDDES